MNQDHINKLTAEAKDIHNKFLLPALALLSQHTDLGQNPLAHADDMRLEGNIIAGSIGELNSGEAKGLEITEGFDGTAEMMANDSHDEERVVLETEDQLRKLQQAQQQERVKILRDVQPALDAYDNKLKGILIEAGVNIVAFHHNQGFARSLAERYLGYSPASGAQETVRVDFVPEKVSRHNAAVEELIQKLVKIGLNEKTLREISQRGATNGDGMDQTLSLEAITALSWLAPEILRNLYASDEPKNELNTVDGKI